MLILRILLLVVIGSVAIGCMKRLPALAPEVIREAQTRVYADIPPKDVLAAAHQVFELLYNEEIPVNDNPDSLVVTRNWATYNWGFKQISGWTRWEVYHDGPTWFIDVEGELDYYGKISQRLVTRPEPFEMFWGRVDYILGLSQDWPECERADVWIMCTGPTPNKKPPDPSN